MSEDITSQIEPFSSQDEVCGVLWDIIEAAKYRTIRAINATLVPVDKELVDDLIYLTSRAGSSYRYHAENPRI